MSQSERILAALRNGPKRVIEMVAFTGLPSKACARTAGMLAHQGLVERRSTGKRGSPVIYSIRSVSGEPPFRCAAARKVEEAYVDARRACRPAEEVAADLGLTPTSAIRFEKAFRAQTNGGFDRDTSCPQFAKDDEHLAAVNEHGGFPDWADLVRRVRSAA